LAIDVAVFGSSEVVPGDAAWEDARRVGELLAHEGFRVFNGGYGGVMEACSLGAAAAGGAAIGITCLSFDRGRGNRHLTEEHPSPDLFERTRSLIEPCAAYIILPGKAGTLAELAFLWALQRGGLLGRRPVVLLGGFWDGFVQHLLERGLLEPAQAAATMHAATAEEAVRIVRHQVNPS